MILLISNVFQILHSDIIASSYLPILIFFKDKNAYNGRVIDKTDWLLPVTIAPYSLRGVVTGVDLARATIAQFASHG